MWRKIFSMSALILVISVAFSFIGVIAAWRGDAPWMPAIVCILGTPLAFLMAIGWQPTLDTVEISSWGVRRRFGGKLRPRTEAVAWSDVTLVELETTAAGPMAEDMFFLIHGGNGKGVVVSGEQASRHGLVPQLQARFPGFDNLALVEASGCTVHRYFHLWPKTDGQVAEQSTPVS